MQPRTYKGGGEWLRPGCRFSASIASRSRHELHTSNCLTAITHRFVSRIAAFPRVRPKAGVLFRWRNLSRGPLILDNVLVTKVQTLMPYLVQRNGDSYAWSPYRYAVYLHWMRYTAERFGALRTSWRSRC
jgi:hypothetical protein